MTAGDLALVVAVVLCALGFAGLVVALMSVQRSLGALQVTVSDLRSETRALLSEMRTSVDSASIAVAGAQASVAEARVDLDRFDRVLGSAEAISTAVGGTSKMARAALSAPVIKTVAVASGARRAGRRLRRQDKNAGAIASNTGKNKRTR
jgi:hypothetical protein